MTRDQLEAVVWQHASNLNSVDPQDRADAMTAILDAAFPPCTRCGGTGAEPTAAGTLAEVLAAIGEPESGSHRLVQFPNEDIRRWRAALPGPPDDSQHNPAWITDGTPRCASCGRVSGMVTAPCPDCPDR